jgi:hypothetical protein
MIFEGFKPHNRVKYVKIEIPLDHIFILHQ